jgi:hypothetical protein
LPEGVMSADELDCSNVLETTYKKLSDHCEDASQDVANMQAGFKKGLLKVRTAQRLQFLPPPFPPLPRRLGFLTFRPRSCIILGRAGFQGRHEAVPRRVAHQGTTLGISSAEGYVRESWSSTARSRVCCVSGLVCLTGCFEQLLNGRTLRACFLLLTYLGGDCARMRARCALGSA